MHQPKKKLETQTAKKLLEKINTKQADKNKKPKKQNIIKKETKTNDQRKMKEQINRNVGKSANKKGNVKKNRTEVETDSE